MAMALKVDATMDGRTLEDFLGVTRKELAGSSKFTAPRGVGAEKCGCGSPGLDTALGCTYKEWSLRNEEPKWTEPPTMRHSR
jgi:hypothetical protein